MTNWNFEHPHFYPSRVEIHELVDETSDSQWIGTGIIEVAIVPTNGNIPWEKSREFSVEQIELAMQYAKELSEKYDIPINSELEEPDEQ